MKKKIIPVLIVLILVIVGVGGYLMGQLNTPAAETPPAQSSTLESPVEPVVDTTTELGAQVGFTEAMYTVYVKASKADEDGVPVYDKAVWDMDTKEIWRTSGGHETQYICIGVGYGEYDGWIEIINANGETGYTQSAWFTQELEVGEDQQVVEQQNPSTNTQSGNNNSGTNQSNSYWEEDEKIEIDYSKIPGYYPDEAPRIPEEDQIHNGGAGLSSDSNTNLEYTGKISG